MNEKLQEILDSIIQLEYANDYLLILKPGIFSNPKIRILVISYENNIRIELYTEGRIDEHTTCSVRITNAIIMDFIDEQLGIMYADL